MALKVITVEGLYGFLRKLKGDYRVVGVKAEDGFFAFAEIGDPQEVVLDYPITLYPLKAFLLPPREEYLRFRIDGRPEVETQFEEIPPTVFFGMHPCDLHSLWLLDTAFMGDATDALYEGRRKNFVFVVMDCLRPCDEYAFCKDMGTLYVDEGYDILLTDLQNGLYAVRTGSDRGLVILERYTEVRDATPREEEMLERIYREREEAFTNRVKPKREELPELLWRGYRSPYWEEVARKCLSCGSCNLVCPTCYCFDVLDEVEINLKEGKRLRTWDGCMLVDFARVAGGENFRPSRADRLRHRFLRKGKYLVDRYGKLGCVGCGRCTRHCLVKINPIEVYNGLYNRIQSEG